MKALMDAATPRWRPLLVVAMFTGMRASELRGLPWSDVDLDQGIIHVRQRADAWGTIGKPKSKAGSRDIPLAPIMVNTLREWKHACPASKFDLVFPNGYGNPESVQNIYKRFWDPVQKKCESPHYGFHALRHVAATLFYRLPGLDSEAPPGRHGALQHYHHVRSLRPSIRGQGGRPRGHEEN
jgi:integrase